jgi:PAS domain S-box-containing protein
MNSFSSNLTGSPPGPWKGRLPGQAEISGLINQISDPVLLVDSARAVILAGNSSFYQLTAFSAVEIVGLNLLTLIPDFNGRTWNAPTPASQNPISLPRHNREPVLVLPRQVSLSTPEQWQLIYLVPQEAQVKAQDRSQTASLLLAMVPHLSALSAQADLPAALNLALDLGKAFLGCGIICIYKADSHVPQLMKIATSETPGHAVLPDTLPATDLMRLRTPALWSSGKRVDTDLHRAARSARLTFLGTAPLRHASAWSGLLVCADQEKLPTDTSVIRMEILAENIATAIQHYILVKHYEDAAFDHHRADTIFKSIAENTRDGIVILKPDLTISEMNPTAEDSLGYASQEVIGQPVENIVIGTESITSALKAAQQGFATPNLGNIRLHRRSGQSFPAQVQIIPVLNNAQPENILIFISDVSENEQFRVRTQQLEQRAVLGEVTAIFAHEVRNPINNISTGLQLISMKLGQDHPDQDLIARLQNDCNRLTHLMDGVLMFARSNKYRMEPVDFDAFITRLFDKYRPRFTRANVQPFYQALVNRPYILGDARSLEQVFTNLVNNAVNAMSDNGGMLSVKIGPTPEKGTNRWEITVSDTGHGIPDEIRDHIFEPFVTTNPQGTGLGLAITKSIITAHRGDITVNSFPGGTVFTLHLPATTGEPT